MQPPCLDSLTSILPAITSEGLSSLRDTALSTIKSLASTISSNTGKALALGALTGLFGLSCCVVQAALQSLPELLQREFERENEEAKRQSRERWAKDLPAKQKAWLDSEEWTKFKSVHGDYITDRVLGVRGPMSRASSTVPITSCLKERHRATSEPEDDAVIALFATVDCHRAMNDRNGEKRLVNADKTDWTGWQDEDLSNRSRGTDVWKMIWKEPVDENDERRLYEELYGDAITSQVGRATVEWALGVIQEAKAKKETMQAGGHSVEGGAA